jgi:hypothetical protein
LTVTFDEQWAVPPPPVAVPVYVVVPDGDTFFVPIEVATEPML